MDIGGTKILAGVADESGKILVSRSFPTITGEGGARGSTVAIADTLRQQCASLGLAFDALSGIGHRVRRAGEPGQRRGRQSVHTAGLGRLSDCGHPQADDRAQG